MNNQKGMLVVFSAPSGCGKDTVFKEILKTRNDVIKSISATTRAPREGEINGKNYYFKTTQEFENLIANDGLLEYVKYNENYYGTPVEGVNKAISDGKICFLIIEVKGAQKVIKMFPDCVSIFLLPPNFQVLEHRLYKRATDDEETIKNRLQIAQIELAQQDKYKYRVVNDELDDCVKEVNAILDKEIQERNE